MSKDCVKTYIFSRVYLLLLALLTTFSVNVSVASSKGSVNSENLGVLQFSQFYLSPQMSLQEPSRGGFELKNSWIAFRWSKGLEEKEEREQERSFLFADLAFGTADMVAPALWYAPKSQNLELTLAKINWKSSIMDFSFGLMQVPFSFEGQLNENEKLMPDTYVRSQSWFARSDYGLQMQTSYKEFLTRVMVHNGESGENLDQKTWATGLWRYQNESGFGVLLTAQVGQTDQRSSGSSLATVRSQVAAQNFVWDPGQSAKHRMGALAIYKQWNQQLILLESGRGDFIQSDEKYPFVWGHFDVVSRASEQLRFLFRYEQSQADLHMSESIIKTTGFGLSWVSAERLSSWTLWAQKHDENLHLQNDQILLQFRLSNQQQ